MKKFILTSSKFEGQVTFGYNEKDILIFLHNEAQMNNTQHNWLIHHLPACSEEIQKLNKILQGKLEELPEDLSLDRFWQLYNKKINRKRCEPLWKKMKEAEKMQCLRSIPHYEQYLNRINWREKADPENYLKKAMYQNDWRNLKG
ncbi:MAG: hypothetical protein EPN37_04415 [Chitinophagaceae bacterium]|nr:MAG: hypothetical protein EPN37_04415 [Chitinophagaceae bacterium]